MQRIYNLICYCISIAMLVINLSVAATVYSPHSATCSSGAFFVAMAITVNGKLNFNIYKTLDISFSGMARF